MAAWRLWRAAAAGERRSLLRIDRCRTPSLRADAHGVALRKPARSFRPAAMTAFLIALTVTAASCGSSASGPSTTSSTSTSTSTTLPGSTVSSSTVPAGTTATDAAVLTAYRAAWSAFEHAGLTANPLDPALKTTMVNPLLHEIEGYLVEDNQEGEVARGTIQLHPHVASLSATKAVVLDCSFSSDFLIYKASGKQVPPVSKPENDGVRATLVYSGSAWKVSQRVITEGSCPAGY